MTPQEPTEQTIESHDVYQGRIVHLRVDTVQLSDGRTAKREIVAHPGSVCVVPVMDDKTVLLVRQFRIATGKFLLEIPAGALNAGETPYASAERELEEETGYRAKTLLPLFAAYPTPGYATERIHAFLATDLVATQTAFDADEQIELVRLPLVELERLIQAGEIEDLKTIAAVLAVRAHLT